MTIYLVEIEGARPIADGGATATLRYCTGTGYVTGPADTPANTVYEPRILDAGTFERHLWASGATRGRGQVSVGLVELANRDGGLDTLFDWAFDGRAITILRGEQADARTAFSTVFRGTLEHVAVTTDKASVRIRDRQAEVADMPLVSARYAGTNVLPAGVEGTADDLKGRPKPVLWAEAADFAPPRVNSSRLIHQISSRPIASITAVYEGGNAITAGVARANLAALEATAPTAGQYDYSLGSGSEGAYIRFGSTPSLTITCTAAEGTAGTRTVGQTIARILVAAGISSGDVSTLAGFDAKNSAAVGWWAGTDEQKVGAALDALAASAGAAWITDRDGAFRLFRLEDPSATTPVETFEEWQILGDVLVTPTADDDRGIPAYEVAVAWGRNYTPLTGAQVAGAVSQARRDYLALPYRTVTERDTAIWDPDARTGRHPLSRPIEMETQFRTEADAAVEASRLSVIYGTRWRRVVFPVAADQIGAADLGKVVAINYGRLGLTSKRLLVTGLREELVANRVTIHGWG